MVRYALYDEIHVFEEGLDRISKLKFLYEKTCGDVDVLKVDEIMIALNDIIIGDPMVEVSIAMWTLMAKLVDEMKLYKEDYLSEQLKVHTKMDDVDKLYG